ncbi:ABC transporter ATP-binding protein [Thermoanaerobacter wiegelii]|uniref:ABC transporter related protein n=1 Tax=Thermoanaerobacter wiegelii Rt8.B1 TaxID=697303 RepID=G2MW51_9THEO|nr:ABC transporter ATP-binding protein [Thermoanaerobacter wiegelii]AEM77939.1 ABC transporter related protein [Thermoanaerobacter wiegelii Rt8.B1]
MLTVKNLYKKYNKSKAIASNNISMDINKGEIVGLLGPNGAGKTTLLKIICGLTIPDSSEVIISNIKMEDKTRLKIMEKIGVVLEGNKNLYWAISVLDNYYYFGSIKGKTMGEIKKNIEKYEDILKTKELLIRKVNTLSMGQKQRVAITASLLHELEPLILDEPSNGLDIESRILLTNAIKTLREEMKITVLIASHDTDFLRKTVDRFIIINNGNIVDEFENTNITAEDIENKYKIHTNLKEV